MIDSDEFSAQPKSWLSQETPTVVPTPNLLVTEFLATTSLPLLIARIPKEWTAAVRRSTPPTMMKLVKVGRMARGGRFAFCRYGWWIWRHLCENKKRKKCNYVKERRKLRRFLQLERGQNPIGSDIGIKPYYITFFCCLNGSRIQGQFIDWLPRDKTVVPLLANRLLLLMFWKNYANAFKWRTAKSSFQGWKNKEQYGTRVLLGSRNIPLIIFIP